MYKKKPSLKYKIRLKEVTEMNKKKVFFLFGLTVVACFFTSSSFAQIRVFEPQSKEEAQWMYDQWAKSVMGEGITTTHYAKTVETEVLLDAAGIGAIAAAAGASLAYAFREIPATVGQQLLKRVGESVFFAGLATVGASLSALGIVVFNPSTAQGSEITPDEQGHFLLYDLHEAMLALSQYPHNLFLQKKEIELNRYYLDYKLHRIKAIIGNNYPEEYTQRLSFNKELAFYEQYLSVLKKEETIISAKVEEYSQSFFESHDEKIKYLWQQFNQAYADMRREENIQKIETATIQKLINGEQDWNAIIEDLSAGKTPRWLELMLSLG